MSPSTPEETPKARKDRLDTLAFDIWYNRRTLKRKGNSFNATDWTLAHEMTTDELARSTIQLEDALEVLEQSSGGCHYQEPVWLHFEKRELLLWQQRRCVRQMQRLTTTAGGGDKSTPSGLALVNKGVGQEDEERVRTAFRERIIDEYACRHPEPEGPCGELLWCPVVSEWVAHTHGVAVQLFDNRHGQETMDAVFGQAEAGGEAELFHPRNGLLMFGTVQVAIEEGVLAIVPDVPSNATAEEICRWRESRPREYKVRILDPGRREANLSVGLFNGKIWKDYDGKRLEFRSEARPSARYLYFHYVTQILRCALRYPFQVGRVPQGEGEGVGTRIWAVSGPYIKRGTIRAFVEEFGREYEHLFGEPEPGGESEEMREVEHVDDDRFYIAAVEQVQHTLREQTFDDEDEDEDFDPEEAEAAWQASMARVVVPAGTVLTHLRMP